MNDAPLKVEHGAPLRLRVERQLGYKMAKYVMRIEAIDSFAALGHGQGRLLGGPRLRMVRGDLTAARYSEEPTLSGQRNLDGSHALGRFQAPDLRLELKAQLRGLLIRKPVRHLRKDSAPVERAARIPRKTLRRANFSEHAQ